MLVLKRRQRELLAETFKDLANIAAGAMIFGHFLSERTFSAWITVAGLGLWLGLVGLAIKSAGVANHE